MATKTSAFAKTPVLVPLAMLCALLWGGAFPAIKIGYQVLAIGASDSARQILFAGVRFTLAGILAWIIGSLLNRRPLIPRRGAWHKVFILCLAQTAVQYFFFYIGLAHTTGVRASILTGMASFLSLLFTVWIYHSEPLTARKVLGCLIGFGGVVLIETGGTGLTGGFHLLGDGMLVISTICSALSSVFLKRFTKDEEPFTMTSWQFFFGGLMLTAAGSVLCRIQHGKVMLFAAAQESGQLGKGILVLLVLAGISAVAYSVWGVLLKHNPVSKVTVFNCLIPVFGTLLSLWLLRESASQPLWVILCSVLLVAVGTLLVQYRNQDAIDA